MIVLIVKETIHTLVETLLKGEEGGKRFCVLWLLWPTHHPWILRIINS